MINNSSLHKWDRLKQKQPDTQFINKLRAGMNCSMFEAKAILTLYMILISLILTIVPA